MADVSGDIPAFCATPREGRVGCRLERARLRLLALLETGEKEEARRLAEYYSTRPYLFDDMGKMGFFLFCRSSLALAERDAQRLASCLTLMAHTQAGARNACLLRVIHQAGGLRQLFATTGPLDRSTTFLASVFWGAHLLAGGGVAAGAAGRGLHVCLSMLRTLSRSKGRNQSWMLPRRDPSSAARPVSHGKDTRPVLVTRAMGGIGDILMMTPGLKALRRKYPDREIRFAVPRDFHTLLDHNPDVALLDIEGEALYQEDCFALYNLTECPATRAESASLPRVRRNRIDIFGAAMGLQPEELDAVGRIPVYTVTEEEREWARFFLKKRNIEAESCIAVHPRAADSYKDYPHMEALVERLAEESPVLALHGTALQGFDHPRVLKIDRRPLRQSIALVSLCKMLIAVDSAFVHIAAALGKKTAALFGPTDGAVFAKYYPRCVVLNASGQAGCRACWRNDSVICGKGASRTSACLEGLSIETVINECKLLYHSN